MKPETITLDGAALRLQAFANGSRKVDVTVFALASDEEPILIVCDSLDPTSAKARAGLLAQLSPSLRDEAAALASELGARLAQMRATRPAESQTAAESDPFPPLAPWPEEVDGAALLDDMRTLLRAHMVLPKYAAEALALWNAHTYVTDVTDYTPYVAVTSPVRECGKSTLLELLLRTAHRAQMTGGITAAALYRRIDKHHPTMLLDELDTRLRGDGGESLRGVLNTGFQRSGKVTICVGDAHEDRDFATFCPKVLAGIGRMWDTVTSRSIPIRLERASKRELAGLRRIRGDRIDAQCEPYRRRFLRWAEDVRASLADADPEVPPALGARQADVWRPLLAIADAAGGKWPALAREAALALHGVAEAEGDYGLLLLADLRALFAARARRALFSETIIEALTAMEDRPWPEYGSTQRPLTKRGLASLLTRFGVRPQQVREGTHEDDRQARGYKLEELEPVFRRYLPSDEGDAPPHSEASHPSHSAPFPTAALSNVTDVTLDPRGMRPGDIVTDAEGNQTLTAAGRERLRELRRSGSVA